jgi:hypothetical protein
LSGLAVKVTSGFFLLSLSAVETEAQRNLVNITRLRHALVRVRGNTATPSSTCHLDYER